MFLKYFEALKRSQAAARQAVRRAALWAPLFAAFLGGASSARAANNAQLNINVDVKAITNIIDLTAVPGTSTGTISLSWTEPIHTAGAAPYSYDVRASSLAQISNDVAFSAAPLLSVFSPDVPPAPGPGGGAAGFVVTGLTQSVTYYFAIREKDSTTFRGAWVRTTVPPRNQNNFAVATSTRPPAPAGGVMTGVGISSITATWAVSSGATDYVLVASTSAANPPTSIVASSTTLSSTATVAGLGPNATYFLFVSACNGGCSAFTALGSTITLAAPAVSLSTTALSSSTVSLAWNPNGNPAGTNFQIQQSTDGVTYAAVGLTSAPGASVAGLVGGGTYYFQIVALNGAGVPASPSNVVRVLTPAGPVPSTPSGFTATAGRLSVALGWTGLPPALQGSGLLYYALLRSTNAAFGYVPITTTTAASFTDKPLSVGTTYFYKIIARDVAAVDSTPSAAVWAVPFGARPMEPLGVTVAPSSAAVTISWTPTSRFFDGVPFVSTGAPTVDELQGYAVYRSTNICDPSYVQISTLSINTNVLTDSTGGMNYFYRLFSYNSVGTSTNVVTLSSLAERNYFMDDCATTMVLDNASALTLNGATNGVGDIRIQRTRRPQDVGNGVYQSAEWRAFLNGATEMKGFVLPKPARVVLRFDTQNGVPVPTTAPANGFTPLASAAAGVPGATMKDLGIYWNNGAEFKKMYGRIDPVAQTVSVETPNLGLFQIRALARAAGAVFDLSNLSSRVITPNGDGLNDVAIFTYDPGPNNVVPEGKIFDLQGAVVADMTPGLVPNTLTWNGFMNGLPVHSGVYLYRITGGGKTFTGSIVVAR